MAIMLDDNVIICDDSMDNFELCLPWPLGDATTIRFILPNVAMPKEPMNVYDTVYVPDPLLSMNIGVHTNGNNKMCL